MSPAYLCQHAVITLDLNGGQQHHTAKAELLSDTGGDVQDPQPCHELGCLFYRGGDYATAKIWLTMANEKMPRPLTAGAPA